MAPDDPVHPILIVVAIAAILALVIFLAWGGALQPNDQLKSGIKLPSDRPLPPVVTPARVDRLQLGMPHSAVVWTLDVAEDSRSRRTRKDGRREEVMTWFNPGGSSIRLTFLDGELSEIEVSGVERGPADARLSAATTRAGG